MKVKRAIMEAVEWLWSLDTRTAEWLIGNVFICRAIAMWMPGDAHESELYQGFKDILPNDFLWGLLYFSIGIVPYIAIIWNGRYRHSPLLRAFALVGASSILAMMTVVFAGTFSVTATALYGSLALSAIYCVFNIAAKMPRTVEETLRG